MPHDIFISYSSKDKPIADGICANLEAAGLRCWIAPRDIAAGEEWPKAITNAIGKSQVMVLVFSSNSNASSDVGREIVLAANEDLTIIPFKIDNTVPEPGKQYYLARTHWLEAMNPPTKAHIKALVDRVRVIIPPLEPGGLVQPEPAPRPAIEKPIPLAPKAKKNRFRSGYLWIGIPLVLILLAVAFWPKIQGMTVQPTITATIAAISTTQPGLTETSLPTLTPTRTATITPTLTPIPIWVTDFAQPILNAISNRPPDYQEDFSQASQDWQLEMMNCKDNGCVISNGVLSLKVNGNDWETIKIPCQLEFKTIVFKVDVNTSKLNGENSAMISYNTENTQFGYEIKNQGRWWYLPGPGLYGWESGQLPLPYPKMVTFTIIVGDTKSAIYLNDTPVIIKEFVAVGNKNFLTLHTWSDGATTARVEYDNLKIWVLDNIANLP